jgi:predicted dehydrogenase
MPDALGVALVGYGYWGPNLLRNYMDLPEAEVKWVCDLRPDALKRTQARYASVPVTTEYEQVLADPAVHAVLVATPISTHHELARAALEAGKHVFVEKPMTHDVGSSRDLIELADQTGLTLMVGHTFVYSPPVRVVQGIIDRGELGDVRYVHTSRINLGLHQKDVSVIWDLMPHDVSIIYSWLGRPAATVSAFGQGCVVPGIPDVAFVVLNFPDRVIAGSHVSWLSPVKLRSTIVVGSKKMLVYDDTENVEKVKIYDHGVDFKDPSDFGEFQLSYRTGDIVSPKVPNTEPLWLEAREFVAAVAEGRPPLTDGRAGLQIVATLEAAERSLREVCGPVLIEQ